MSGISTPELVAINKAITSKTVNAAMAALPPGEHEIDVTVRIKGKIVKGEDTMRVPTANVPLLPALALVAKYAGATGPAAINAIIDAVREAATMDKDAAEALVAREGIDIALAKLKAQISSELPKVRRAGVTKAYVGLETLQPVIPEIPEFEDAQEVGA